MFTVNYLFWSGLHVSSKQLVLEQPSCLQLTTYSGAAFMFTVYYWFWSSLHVNS